MLNTLITVKERNWPTPIDILDYILKRNQFEGTSNYTFSESLRQEQYFGMIPIVTGVSLTFAPVLTFDWPTQFLPHLRLLGLPGQEFIISSSGAGFSDSRFPQPPKQEYFHFARWRCTDEEIARQYMPTGHEFDKNQTFKCVNKSCQRIGYNCQ